MTSPKRFSTKGSGFMLVDVMIALALSVLFVSGMTEVSLEARDIYDRAHIRAGLLAAYQDHAAEFEGMMPYESRARTYPATEPVEAVTMDARALWYGNDRIETDIAVRQGSHSVTFVAVRMYPYASISDAAGTPLCSPEMSTASGPLSADIIPVLLPVSPLLPLTDIEVRDGIAYVTADSSTAADPDFLVIDISDPKDAHVMSSLNTGPGLRSVSVEGSYAFAAAASTAAQLHVIRLVSPFSLTLVKKYQLPLPTPTTTPAMGSSIFYDKGIIYLGTEKWNGNELQTIDVTDPADPKALGGFDVGSKVNDIYMRNKLAYIASASQNQVQTLDVSDAAHPYVQNSFSSSGWERQEGETLSSFEDALTAGRTSGGFDIVADPELFSWPPASSSPLSLNIPGGVYGIVADRYHLYLATRNVDRELTILDRSIASSSAAYYSLPVAPQAMTCDGDTLYILAHNAPALYEINLHTK